MNRLFVHNPWFRLLAPLFCGVLLYLLILLINDAVLIIQESFLTQELYICIILAYLTQELSRGLLLVFERLDRPKSFLLRMGMQIVASLILTVILVSTAIYLYFKYILLYVPNIRELYIFNSLYSFVTLFYVLLYLGHYFLNRRNIKLLTQEERAKTAIEADFASYQKGINPELLFESLEAMLVSMKRDPDRAEKFSDLFATVYRYILSRKKNELVPLEEEVTILKEQVKLLNFLPLRKIKLGKVPRAGLLVVPTSLLSILEVIARTTILSMDKTLVVDLSENEHGLQIRYEADEKLRQPLTLDILADVMQSYTYYSNTPIEVHSEGTFKIVQLPKLTLDESRNH